MQNTSLQNQTLPIADTSPGPTPRSSDSTKPGMVSRDTVKDLADAMRKSNAADARQEPSKPAFAIPKPLTPEEDEAVRAWLEKQEAAEGLAARVRLFEASGIPLKYREAKVSELQNVPPDAAPSYAKSVTAILSLLNGAGMVALIGDYGAGKTWMACGLVKEFCRLGRPASYMEAMDYALALQETFDDGSKMRGSQVENRYIKPELLVIDALEERADTAWNDRMLTRLVNKRYAACKSTLLISNEQEAAFKARVGPSIVDRIRDGGGIVVCDWGSLRGRIQQ